jgi:phosphoglycerate kinase
VTEAVTQLGVHDILIGHSEQIELTGITDSEISWTANDAHRLKNMGDLSGAVLVAVGETLTDYKTGRSKEIITQQVLNRLNGLTAQQVAGTVIPYEPRWAIGTGLTPTLQEIEEVHQAIRNTIKAEYGLEASQKARIVYGGSFSLKKTLDPTGEKTDAEMILALKDVDGALIGTASIIAKDFAEMVAIAQKVYDQKRAKWGIEREMYMAGNHKSFPVKNTYEEFVNLVNGTDRRKVEVALGPELNRISELIEVYTKDPSKDIVFIDQLRDEEIQDTVVYLREDFNIAVNDVNARPNNPDTWEITGDARIRAALPSAQYVLDRGGLPVLVTHFDPKGKNLSGPQSVSFMVPHIKQAFKKYLGMDVEVVFVSDMLGSAKSNALTQALENIKKGKKTVVLLENVRLSKEIAKLEKADKDTPDDIAARNKLATQLYTSPNRRVIAVNDGIGVMHRNQGTVTGDAPGVARLGGISLRNELIFSTTAIRDAQHPIAIVFGGGAKISDKIPMLRNIILNKLTHGDKIFVYGGAAAVFSLAMDPGFEPGLSRSMIDEGILQTAREIIELAEEEGIEIVRPLDSVVADNLPADEGQAVTTSVVPADKVPASKGIYDIGPKTVKQFAKEVLTEDGKSKFGLIIWNGPAGVFEYEQFRAGSDGIADVVAKATKSEQNPDGAVTILGGGDTGYMAELLGIADKVTSVSNGGGAWLELLEGKDLPGVKVLRDKAGHYAYHLNANIERSFEKIHELVSDYAAKNAQSSSPAKQPLDSGDAETITKTGGINLNRAGMKLQIRRDRDGVPLPLPQQPVGQMNIDGLVPIIINMQWMSPAQFLPANFLGRIRENMPADTASPPGQDGTPLDLSFINYRYRNRFFLKRPLNESFPRV